jgi:PilZ domain
LEQERRRTPRYPFIATAEVIEQTAHSSTSTRVTELSLHGCFLEVTKPLAKGVELKVKIYSEGKFFEGPGTVVYALPEGIGVSFHDVHPQYLSVLKRWLLAAAVAKYGQKP